jgi:hypothetical protein
MREARAYNVLIVIAMLSQFSAYVCVHCGIPEVRYRFNSFTMAICFGLPVFARYVHKNEWSRILTMYAILLSTNQLVDEFFLDPTRLQLNEVFVGAFVLFHLLTKLYYAIRTWI